MSPQNMKRDGEDQEVKLLIQGKMQMGMKWNEKIVKRVRVGQKTKIPFPFRLKDQEKQTGSTSCGLSCGLMVGPHSLLATLCDQICKSTASRIMWPVVRTHC